MRFLKACFNYLLPILLCCLSSTVHSAYVNFDIHDSGDSNSRSGVKTPREYFLPPVPSYEKFDAKEFEDYLESIRYSPYAQLQLQHPVQSGNIKLKEGYYLVKLDVVPNHPAPLNTPSNNSEKKSVSLLEKLSLFGSKNEAEGSRAVLKKVEKSAISSSIKSSSDTTSPTDSAHLSMMIKKEGSVELVIPVNRSTRLAKRLKKREAFQAELVTEQGDSIKPQIIFIKYCSRNFCYYSAPLEPGLVQ